MTFNELLNAQELNAQETFAANAGISPVGLYVRAIRSAVGVVVNREGEREGLANRRTRGVLQEAGVYDAGADPASIGEVLARLDGICPGAMEESTGPSIVGSLCDGISDVFGYSVEDRGLLWLAIHATRCRKLQRVLDLPGEMDDEDTAELFADILNLGNEGVLAALRKPNPFRRMPSFEVLNALATPFQFLKFGGAAASVVRNNPTVKALLELFCRPSPQPRLAMSDYQHQGPELAMLQRYLRHACESSKPGVNILLHGRPGTGKTELVRALAAALGCLLVEVPSVDEDKDPLPPWKRLTSLVATQEMLRSRPESLVLFDEIEDIFPADGAFPFGGGHRPISNRIKGWLTQVLEENARPTFWVCNEIAHIDPAYIRRFDMAIELEAPRNGLRDSLVETLFAGLPLHCDALAVLKADASLAPAHLERIATVLKTMAPATAAEAAEMLGTLERQTFRALSLPVPAKTKSAQLAYRPDCINTDIDLQVLSDALGRLPSARICLFGPPGTGKTEWARQLALRIQRPLHVRRASDLLGKYVGESERLIRDAFEGAARDSAVLLIDEADSLLRDRSTATQGWQASIVNEILTCMERFEGIFVASTNLEATLDKASARRFDFKVAFGYLSTNQVRTLLSELLVSLGRDGTDAAELDLRQFVALTPGDFANVLRQERLMGGEPTPARLLRLLAKEQEAKGVASGLRRFGFV